MRRSSNFQILSIMNYDPKCQLSRQLHVDNFLILNVTCHKIRGGDIISLCYRNWVKSDRLFSPKNMQQTGTLRKRRKRNLSKVNGLSTITYNEAEDIFDGRALFNAWHNHNPASPISHPISIKSGDDTRIWMNSSIFLERSRSAQRVTRNPTFHDPSLPEVVTDKPPKQRKYRPPRKMEGFTRSRFLDGSTMSRLHHLLWLGVTSGAFPWSWNEQEYCIDKWGPTMEKIWWIQWIFVSIQSFFLNIFNFYVFFHQMGIEAKGGTYRKVFMSSFSVMWYFAAIYYILNTYLYLDQTRQYINTLLKFNKDRIDKYVVHLDGYKDGGRIVINLAIPSTILQVFISVLFFILMPFQPWFLISYIYPKPWYWLIPGIIQHYVLYASVTAYYSLTAWMVAAHTNSINFWLTESQ